mmetsp:Transcript_34575/g.74723  ORF Transcript_34575/g.74723 Transcript_34575/m.74723 type:complete len:190 (+) Transcript_34575:373-942(+)
MGMKELSFSNVSYGLSNLFNVIFSSQQLYWCDRVLADSRASLLLQVVLSLARLLRLVALAFFPVDRHHSLDSVCCRCHGVLFRSALARHHFSLHPVRHPLFLLSFACSSFSSLSERSSRSCDLNSLHSLGACAPGHAQKHAYVVVCCHTPAPFLEISLSGVARTTNETFTAPIACPVEYPVALVFGSQP